MGMPLDDSLSSSLLTEDIVKKGWPRCSITVTAGGKPAYSHYFEIA